MVERQDWTQKIAGTNPIWGNHLKHDYHSSVLFSGNKYLLEIVLVGLNFFAILAVAYFANINSNE